MYIIQCLFVNVWAPPSGERPRTSNCRTSRLSSVCKSVRESAIVEIYRYLFSLCSLPFESSNVSKRENKNPFFYFIIYLSFLCPDLEPALSSSSLLLLLLLVTLKIVTNTSGAE